MKSQSNLNPSVLCDFMESQITKTIRGHTLSTDAGDKSSYAATKGALTVRSDIQKRDIRMMTAIWDDIVNLIFMRNGYIEAPRPKMVPYHSAEVDMDRANRDEALTRAGVVFNKSYFIRTYNLEDEDIKEVVEPGKLQATGAKKVNDKDKPLIDVEGEQGKVQGGE